MSNLDHRYPWATHPRPALSAIQKQWLMRSGALTAGLRTFGALELRVLAEYPAGLSRDEAGGLLRPVSSPVWVREVAMRLNGMDCVVARSVTPLIASHSTWQGVRVLRSRPLADILYNDRSIQRSAFEVCRLSSRMPLYRTSVKVLQGATRDGQAHDLNIKPALLARRSVFWRQNTPLLVAECFLPGFWQIAGCAEQDTGLRSHN